MSEALFDLGPLDVMRSWATISDDGLYRYELGRQWDTSLPTLTFIMLNPSTADAHANDPTIRRCIGFAKRDGFGTLVVVNLFALRATDPRELLTAAHPIGPDNRMHLRLAIEATASGGGETVAAWGTFQWTNRDRLPRPRVEDMADELLCLGTTKHGLPRHPLYVRGDQPLERWSW